MEDLVNLFLQLVGPVVAALPPHVAEVIGGIVAGLVALRTCLRALIYAVRGVDVALDGIVDWHCLDGIEHVLTQLDSWAGWAVISAALPAPKPKGGAK
jgi:hypothetical protein